MSRDMVCCHQGWTPIAVHHGSTTIDQTPCMHSLLQVKRVRYLLKLYYRTRLKKIEKYAACILDDDSMSAKLSP